jgi:hypothetical protein
MELLAFDEFFSNVFTNTIIELLGGRLEEIGGWLNDRAA